MRCEILTDPEMAARGDKMLRAMIKRAPIEVRVREEYVGDCDLLMVYGSGHPVRRPWLQAHARSGRHWIAWDLGYWKHKEDGTCRMRVTIDADHPPQWLRPEPADRWDREGIALRDDFNPDGPIIIVGQGRKSTRAQGSAPLAWEASTLREVRMAYRDRRILFRPKRRSDPRLPVPPLLQDNIADALRGASLVVCRHSNVAVDACIAGIPVVCFDGAASALYGADISNPRRPSPEERLAFLRSLAWWQWKPEEASEAWTYLLHRLSA